MFLVFLLYALFASVFTIAKTGLAYSKPFFFIGFRMLLAGIAMVAYQWIFNRAAWNVKKSHLPRIFGLALFNIYLTNACEFWGLQYLSSSKTCFIYSLSPFFSALLSFFVFSEKISSKKWLGLGIGFAGMLPILLAQTSEEELAGHFFVFSWAELAVMCAAGCSVYGWILLKQLIQENGYTPMTANGMSMLIGGAMALIHSLCTETWHPVPVTEFAPFFGCTMLLILISNFICYNLYGRLLKTFSATFMSFAGLSTPLFAAFFGWFLLSEEIPLPFYLSLALVSLGLFSFYQEELRPVEEPKILLSQGENG